MTMRRLIPFAVLTLVACPAAPASAELAFFANGRSLSIKEHHVEGESLVLSLRNGGQIVCDPSTVVRFAPDEVPYPEPAPLERGGNVEGAVSADDPAVRYAEIIDRVSAEQGVNPKIVRAVIRVESAYKGTARSPKGAMGLMQLMPETARQYSVADPYDPASNIEAGVRHLRSLLDRLPLELALAAYNAGEAAVRKFRGIPPYPETRDYVSRIVGLLSH